MKRLILIFAVLLTCVTTIFSQGRANFNNIDSGNVITFEQSFFGFAPQTMVGDFLGSQYSIQLRWVPGIFVGDQVAFAAAGPSSSPPVSFFGSTGSLPLHGPLVDAAGYFDGGVIPLGGPAGTYTMQARVWYNNGQHPTFNDALNAAYAIGVSQLFTMNATAPPNAAPNTDFTFGVPEPSVGALAGLALVATLIFRRR